MEAIFRHKVFCMLIAKRKISREMIVMLSTWRHSGFHALCRNHIQPNFYGSGSFKVAPALDTKPLEKLFQHKVLGMLLRKGKITEEVVKLIMSWRHSGFYHFNLIQNRRYVFETGWCIATPFFLSGVMTRVASLSPTPMVRRL